MDNFLNNESNASYPVCDENFLGPKRDHLYIVIPITVIYVIIFITGTVGNISTCIVIAKNKSMHTATNYYLFSLAISDLLLLVSGLPQEIYLIWSRYPYIFGGTFCFMRGLFAETSANATVLIITAFTVERYLAICHPFLSHTMSKLSRAIKFILAIWLVAVCLAIPHAIPLKVMGDCALCLIHEPIVEHSFEVSTFLFFIAPITLISVLYVLIGMRLKSSRMMKKRSHNGRIQSNSSRKVVKMLVAVVVAFCICWAPFHVQRLYSVYSNRALDDKTHFLYMKIYELLTYVSGVLYYVSTTINPILYNIMSVKFREAFKETFARCCGLGHLHNGKPQRYYSALSKSNQRGPDSTDSGKDDQTNTTLTHKNSVESYCVAQVSGKRYKTSTSTKKDSTSEADQNSERVRKLKDELQQRNSAPTTYLTLPVTNTTPPRQTKFSKFLQFFECLTKRTLDDSKKYSSYYSSPVRDQNIILELQRKDTGGICHQCDISNSSLKDIEQGAIEDELTAYMKELKRRECYNS